MHNGFSHRNLSTQAEAAYLTVPLQFLSNTFKQFYSDEHVEGRIYASFQGPMSSGIGVSNDHGENIFGFQSPKIYMHEIISQPSNRNVLFCSLSDDWAHCDLVRFDISDVDNIQQTTIALPEQGFLSDIHFDINNNVVMWIALANHIYKSNDNGLTWTPQNLGLELLTTNDVINKICQNPLNPSQLTIATTKGVFTSTNQGGSWTQLSSLYTDYVKHSASNDNHLVAITYDGEFTSLDLRLSNDQGTTWSQVEREDILYVNSDRKSTAVDFDGDSAVFYIGTYDLGVLKYTIDLTTLGQNEIENNLQVIISPNPAQNILNILTQETIKEVSVYDLLGKKVTVNQISTNAIDVSNLAQGIYIIKVIGDNDKTFTKKFIKNN
ncbi:MAG: T9SS type A sorting domain-containing protein [Flavobacterium sp. JAD_PAG50586_2]|nr:MAG: T9SS type A sorting domain-containing protein [Flavobacterium sp. JAD_PAG50586_2]